MAARRSRRCSSGVPGKPDFISGFSVDFEGVLGAWGFIASTLLHRVQRNPGPHHACTLLTWALTRNEKRPRSGGRFWLYIWDSGGRIRTCDLRVMSPNLGCGWTTWGTVSSGFRDIELRGDRLESVGRVAPFVAPAGYWRSSSRERESPEARRVFGSAMCSFCQLPRCD